MRSNAPAGAEVGRARREAPPVTPKQLPVLVAEYITVEPIEALRPLEYLGLCVRHGFLADPVVKTADSACLLYPTQMRCTRGGDSYYSCSSRRIPRRCAIATASVRVVAFNLPNIALTYVLTVPSVTVSFCAIFLLLSPTIICRRVASSLAVNASFFICSAIRCATRAPTATPPLCTDRMPPNKSRRLQPKSR